MFNKKEKEEEKKEQKPVGGLPFFISIICLVIISINNLIFLPKLIYEKIGEDGFFSSLQNLIAFASISLFSALLAKFFLKHELAVLIHEFKHRIFANLVGNKYKSMKIGRDEGYVEYEYTKKTRIYNALIALAPYYFPLFSIIIGFVACIFCWGDSVAIMTFIAVGYGADFYLGIADVGPHQTDFTNIEGGYYVALVYVIAVNTCILTTLLAFAFNGVSGLTYLCMGLAHIAAFFLNIIQDKFTK